MEISILDKGVESLQACLTVAEVAKTSVGMMQALFTGASGNIFTINNSQTQVESIASFGNEIACKATFGLEECWGLRRNQLHSVDGDQSLLCRHFLDSPPAEYLCVPLAAQGKLVGMFHLNFAQNGKLRERQKKLASLIGEQIALALANMRLREELKNQSIRDSLTGLFNRRYLEEALEQELARADRSGKEMSLLMIDIDYFKRFNDHFGHEAGDYVLEKIGSLLNKSIRKGDVACRYGGEEFVVLFPETTAEISKKMAEKLLDKIRQLELKYINVPLGMVTISVGLAVYPLDGHAASEILREADIALYNAKSLGRDRVVVWRDISPPPNPLEGEVDLEKHRMDLMLHPSEKSVQN